MHVRYAAMCTVGVLLAGQAVRALPEGNENEEYLLRDYTKVVGFR